jgi:hypothetical protein
VVAFTGYPREFDEDLITAKVEAGAEKPIRPLVLLSQYSESLANLMRGTLLLVTE